LDYTYATISQALGEVFHDYYHANSNMIRNFRIQGDIPKTFRFHFSLAEKPTILGGPSNVVYSFVLGIR
jgi:hypothetical protein